MGRLLCPYANICPVVGMHTDLILVTETRSRCATHLIVQVGSSAHKKLSGVGRRPQPTSTTNKTHRGSASQQTTSVTISGCAWTNCVGLDHAQDQSQRNEEGFEQIHGSGHVLVIDLQKMYSLFCVLFCGGMASIWSLYTRATAQDLIAPTIKSRRDDKVPIKVLFAAWRRPQRGPRKS